MPPIFIPPGASERELLVQLLQLVDANHTTTLERLITMSQIATDTAAAVTAENAKVDQLIALVSPTLQALRDALATANAEVARLTADATADTATLQGSLAAATDETAKVQAAIDALTPPAAP